MTDSFSGMVQRLSGTLAPAAARVALYLDQNRAIALASSAAQIAAKLRTSDATVIRTVQALGYDGLPGLKQALAASLAEPATPAANMRRMLSEVGESASEAIVAVLDAHAEAMADLCSKAGRAAVLAAVNALHTATRIAVFGIGPSAHLARYVTLQLNRAGRSSATLDATGWALADQLLGLQSGDALLLLCYGQPYREVRGVLSEARRLSLPVVMVTDAADSALARDADVVVLARRGRANRVALHATTLAALESIILGLAAIDRDEAIAQLTQLDRLRKLVTTPATRSNSQQEGDE